MIALQVLGNIKTAKAWLIRPAYGLDYRAPCSLLWTLSGCDDIHLLLMRLDHGILASA
ncbi:DUF2384 domain-containing protein [Pseudomonas brassicacearum]|uniref:antitoxin Xre/MbcA/ParS toxin-binding domain-containing protein n=1 Tax=Pseudomonas brassicacearum TaxID=930166 RepID=UPI00346505BE